MLLLTIFLCHINFKLSPYVHSTQVPGSFTLLPRSLLPYSEEEEDLLRCQIGRERVECERTLGANVRGANV